MLSKAASSIIFGVFGRTGPGIYIYIYIYIYIEREIVESPTKGKYIFLNTKVTDFRFGISFFKIIIPHM